MNINDKIIEQNRYNYASEKKLKLNNYQTNKIGSQAYSLYIQPPYIKYESLIKEITDRNHNVFQLDLCCGDGLHSFTAASQGANVIALDFAENSIEIAKRRAKEFGITIDFKVCDVENLPFDENSFDLITCIGSLSYLNHDVFISEVKRVLKPGGVFICVDSLNHNIFYRLNRFIHFLKKERSYSTLKRMPTISTVNKIGNSFSNINTYYFGIFIFIEPILKLFINEEKVANLILKLDYMFPIFNKYAFKIVFKTIK